MDQQGKTPEQRRSRARRKPGPVAVQVNQPPVSPQGQNNPQHDPKTVVEQPKQLPTPPGPPKTDDRDAWSTYRDMWQTYSKEWQAYWEVKGQPERAKQAEGEAVYRAAWHAHWQDQGVPWRTEPEIDQDRQRFLNERRSIRPEIQNGVYPFRDQGKGIRLTRADVEWLLVTHENGKGPIDWYDPSQRVRQGLDLRGADLQGVDLRELPLTQMRAGLLPWSRAGSRDEWFDATPEQREQAGVHLERVDLSYTHLDGATFSNAHLEGARIESAHLEGARFRETHLEGVSLNGSYMDPSTHINGVYIIDELHGSISLADVRWGGVNLSRVDWAALKVEGNAGEAYQRKTPQGKKKDRVLRLREYARAVRSHRQLATVLRDQGLNEEANDFAYRAQLHQRVVLRLQRKILKLIGSWTLWLIAGYGYRPLRSFLIYIFLIFGFATAYLFIGPIVNVPFSPLGALVFSVTSFHGRGFFPGGSPGHSITLDDPLTVVAAAEAVVGLLIEISFIATFTQRYFGK